MKYNAGTAKFEVDLPLNEKNKKNSNIKSVEVSIVFYAMLGVFLIILMILLLYYYFN